MVFHSCDDCILYMKFETTKEKSCVLVVGGRCVCKIKGRIVNKKKDRKTSWITKCLVYDDGLKGMKSCDFALLFSILYTNKKYVCKKNSFMQIQIASSIVLFQQRMREHKITMTKIKDKSQVTYSPSYLGMAHQPAIPNYGIGRSNY